VKPTSSGVAISAAKMMSRSQASSSTTNGRQAVVMVDDRVSTL